VEHEAPKRSVARMPSVKRRGLEFGECASQPKAHARTEAQDQRAIHCLNLVVTVFAYHSVVRFLDNLSL
jgi:hypothetical protein